MPRTSMGQILPHCNHLHAKMLTKSLHGKTPHQKWYGCDPDNSYMHEIGCKAFVLVPTHNPKVKPQSIKCVLMGYRASSNTYRCWDKKNNKVDQSYHVRFIKNYELPSQSSTQPQQTTKHQQLPCIPTLQDLDKSVPLTLHKNDDNFSEFEIQDTIPAITPGKITSNRSTLDNTCQEDNADLHLQ